MREEIVSMDPACIEGELKMTQDDVDALKAALQEQFGGDVQAECVDERGRYRFAVISSRFESTPHLQRQDAIWEVVDRVLSREVSDDISMILAFTPKDFTPAD
jgi:hypothetical protein